MPTYAYECPKCGHTYDKFQKITDQTKAKCPECGTRGTKVISGGAGVVFKGSGFYETDYKRAAKKSDKKKSKTEGKGEIDKKPAGDASKSTKKSGEGS